MVCYSDSDCGQTLDGATNTVRRRFSGLGRDCPSQKLHAAAQPSRPREARLRARAEGPRAGIDGENGVAQSDERQARPYTWNMLSSIRALAKADSKTCVEKLIFRTHALEFGPEKISKDVAPFYEDDGAVV
jgi:hypothetical protein